jgi:hypothetical protein
MTRRAGHTPAWPLLESANGKAGSWPDWRAFTVNFGVASDANPEPEGLLSLDGGHGSVKAGTIGDMKMR